MKCPFCTSVIGDEAVVCQVCCRDITIPKPVIEANRRLEEQVAMLQSELAEARQALGQRGSAADPVMKLESASQLVATYLVLPIALLLALYFVLIIWIDTNPLWLRFATSAVALVFGYALEATRRPRWIAKVSFALTIAVVSVLGMATILRIAQGVPVLDGPRETIEFMVSIGLAGVVGCMLGTTARASRFSQEEQPHSAAGFLARLVVHNLPQEAGASVQEETKRWEKRLQFAGTVLMTIGMLYSGFSKFHL